jgi:hypothetical protein
MPNIRKFDANQKKDFHLANYLNFSPKSLLTNNRHHKAGQKYQ